MWPYLVQHRGIVYAVFQSYYSWSSVLLSSVLFEASFMFALLALTLSSKLVSFRMSGHYQRLNNIPTVCVLVFSPLLSPAGLDVMKQKIAILPCHLPPPPQTPLSMNITNEKSSDILCIIIKVLERERIDNHLKRKQFGEKKT